MTRRAIAFVHGPDTLIGTLDDGDPHALTGVLIVSGGTEIRAGAFAGMARLAMRLSTEAGVPVLRFDRRGIGDSSGQDGGWRNSSEDIAAALAALRAAQPGLRRVVGFGICDGASALMMHGAGLDGLVLVNPWTFDDNAGDAITHAPATLRRRYLARLIDPRSLWRLISGQVDLRKLWRGLNRAASRNDQKSPLADALQASLAQCPGPVSLLIAAGDRVGARFLEVWPSTDARLQIHPGNSHSFTTDAQDQDWLVLRLIEATMSRH